MFETTTSEVDARTAEIARGYVVEATGLRLLGNPDKLTHMEWVELGRSLRTRADSSAWALGDWLLEGGRTGRAWLGNSSYDKAIEITGYSLSFLSRCYRTANAFPRDGRRLAVSWLVHMETLRAPSDMRQGLLTDAEQGRWTADVMRQHIDALLGGQSARPMETRSPLHKAYYKPRKVKCPECGHVFPVQGHKLPLEPRTVAVRKKPGPKPKAEGA